jgi:signal peptidase I
MLKERWFSFLEAKRNKVVKEEREESWQEFLKSLLTALLFVIFFRSFVLEVFCIPSGSMKPGLLVGDYIVVSKFRYGYSKYFSPFPFAFPFIRRRIFDFTKPKRGEVIVFRGPHKTGTNYIKRLVGLPHDRVEVIHNVVHVNGQEIKREYVGNWYDMADNRDYLEFLENLTDKPARIIQNMDFNFSGDGVFEVPAGYYMFMGDNRDLSLDSRFPDMGFVPYQNIVGKALLVIFSKRDSIFKIWKWHKIIRFNRIFKKIN